MRMINLAWIKKWKKTVSILTLSIGFILLTSFTVSAEKFEVPSNRKVTDIFPADMITGPHYQIRDKVVSYGYMDHFTVDSDYGVFEVTGDLALRKLLKEIKAIAVLEQIKDSAAYADALKSAGEMPVEFGKNLITDPVDTLSGIPKGVTGLFKNIATSLSSPHDPSEDSRTEQALAVSSYKRDYAYELGVDVYSSNPVLQKELNRVGWAGALGSLTMTAALAPFGGPGVMVVKTTRLAQQFNNLLKEEPPARLRQINGEKLAVIGVPDDLANQFLDHPSFTPRHDTIIVGSLALLKDAQGRDAFIRYILAADDEETANFFQDMAETMRGYQETVSPITEIRVVSGLVFARAKDGAVLIPLPLDHGVWSQRADQVVNGATKSFEASDPNSKGKFALWVTGTVTPLAKEQLALRGVKITEHVDKKIEFSY